MDTARPWYKSSWVRVGGAVVFLALAAALTAPFLIPVDRFRPLLVRFLDATTGRNIQIDALRLHLLPTIHIQAVNVRLKNAKGFPDGDAILMKSVDLGVDPRALLSRQLVVTGIAIKTVHVRLLSDPAGRTNFDAATPGRTPPSSKTPAAPGGPPLLTLGHIGAVTVRNVEMTLADIDSPHRRITPMLTLAGVNAGVRSIDPNAANWMKRLDVGFDLRGTKLTTSSLAKPVVFESGDLRIRAGGARGTFSASLDRTKVTGTVTIARFDPLSILFTVATPELDVNAVERLVTHNGAGSAHVPSGPSRLLARGDVKVDRLLLAPFEATRAAGQVSIYTNAVHLDSYALSAYGGTIQGAAALNYGTAGLPASATAIVRGLKLEPVLSALSPRTPRIGGALDADLKVTTAFARDPRASLLARGPVKMDRLVLSPLEATRLSGDLSVGARTIRLDSTTLTAYGGTVRGAAALNYALANLPTVVAAKAQGVNVASLLSALSPGARKVTGALEANLNLATALARDPQAALTGSGIFAVRDGSFPGLDLKNNLAQVARTLQVNVPAGDTRFRYFGGDLRIAQQRAYSNALQLNADELDGTARGSIGFNHTLDYTGTSVLKSLGPGTSLGASGLPSVTGLLGRVVPGAASVTGARVPFSLRGTIDAPKFSLAGVPQFLRDQSPQQQQPPPQQPQQPSLPELFKLLQKP